jgi:hypothetical protein
MDDCMEDLHRRVAITLLNSDDIPYDLLKIAATELEAKADDVVGTFKECWPGEELPQYLWPLRVAAHNATGAIAEYENYLKAGTPAVDRDLQGPLACRR